MALTYLYIAIGSAVGGMARFWLSTLVAGGAPEAFPWGTIIVNITGSFLIGFFASVTGPDVRVNVSENLRLFLMVGICGGYTTFSSFSLQTLLLARDGEMARASGNVAISVVACLAAVWLGYAVGTMLNRAKDA